MTARKKNHEGAPAASRSRNGHGRQRQRLIDACISALHLHGPSRTTVEKVVAIAKMSPGIVRFYFDSKAAMLVASLEYLAADFEERVMRPVGELKATPVAALQSLVERHLDPDIASPRKVSVWYAFWGEASSRGEYYDICGQKDEGFAALVRELVEALIHERSFEHLDPDGIALGLIGVLEMLWQDIAFQTERDIDRVAARRRATAFLRSVFPGCFGPAGEPAAPLAAPFDGGGLAGWVYGDAGLFAMERDLLFQPSWSVVGHESQLPREGDYLALDVGVERVIVVRDGEGALHALRNSCPTSPHTVVSAGRGRLVEVIECKAHGLRFSLDGHGIGTGLDRPGLDRPRLDRPGLRALELRSVGGLLFIRSPGAGGVSEPVSGAMDALAIDLPAGLMLLGSPTEVCVEADWKGVVESWLEAPQGLLPSPVGVPAAPLLAWAGPVSAGGSEWSMGRYTRLLDCLPTSVWRRCFLPPNHWLEIRPDGLSVMQVLPLDPGRCRLRRFDYTVLAPGDGARAAQYLARRIGGHVRRATLTVVESVQKGRLQYRYSGACGSSTSSVAWFRDFLVERIPALGAQRPPTGR